VDECLGLDLGSRDINIRDGKILTRRLYRDSDAGVRWGAHARAVRGYCYASCTHLQLYAARWVALLFFRAAHLASPKTHTRLA
jgi:hypothetical protein